MKQRVTHKFPIQWHKDCLVNRKNNLRRKIAELQALAGEINKQKEEIAFYESQIELAEKRGMVEFDQNRLGVGRSRKDE